MPFGGSIIELSLILWALDIAEFRCASGTIFIFFHETGKCIDLGYRLNIHVLHI
jgi:hypothetical protein